MTGWITEKENEVFLELSRLDPELVELARPRDGTGAMVAKLFEKYPEKIINENRVDHGSWQGYSTCSTVACTKLLGCS
jgi:hypothetical protein